MIILSILITAILLIVGYFIGRTVLNDGYNPDYLIGYVLFSVWGAAVISIALSVLFGMGFGIYHLLQLI
mgnify:CR=1 FL=1